MIHTNGTVTEVRSVADALLYVACRTYLGVTGFRLACPTHGKKYFAEAERLGLLRSEEAQLCDGDGFAIQPEKWVIGYETTEPGKEATRKLIMETPL